MDTDSPAVNGQCLLLSLPAELREAIYIFHLAQYPEIIHYPSDYKAEDSSYSNLGGRSGRGKANTIAPRSPLVNVNQQIRREVAALLPFHATKLLQPFQGLGLSSALSLVLTLGSAAFVPLDKRSSAQPPSRLSEARYASRAAVQALEQRCHPNFIQYSKEAFRCYPHLQSLVFELRPMAGHWDFMELNVWAHTVDRKAQFFPYPHQEFPLAAMLRIEYRLADTVTCEQAKELMQMCEKRLLEAPGYEPRDRPIYPFRQETLQSVVTACQNHIG